MAHGTIDAPEKDIPTPDAAETAKKTAERAEQDGQMQQELSDLATKYADDVQAVLKEGQKAAEDAAKNAEKAEPALAA